MGIGLLFSALSGGAQGYGNAIEQQQKFDNERALMQERAALEEEKALRLDELKRTRDRDAGVKQGQEIDAEVQSMQNRRDAAAINAANGSNMTAEDAQVLRDKPEARKAYGLLNATRQSDLEDRSNAAEKLGYLDAAKETRGALQNEITNQRNEANDKTANKRADNMQEYQQRREDRMDRLAQMQESRLSASEGKAEARAEKADAREQRAATAKALDGANADVKALEKEAANMMLDPGQAAVVKQQLAEARSEAARYRGALASVGVKGSEAPTDKVKPPKPIGTLPDGAKQIGTSGGKPVYQTPDGRKYISN